jgi:hypothetical protein
MQKNDQELQGKINNFLRRKQAQYPDLTQPRLEARPVLNR